MIIINNSEISRSISALNDIATNLNVPITGVHSYEEEEEEEDAMVGVVPGDNEVDEGSLIISEDPDNESTV